MSPLKSGEGSGGWAQVGEQPVGSQEERLPSQNEAFL